MAKTKTERAKPVAVAAFQASLTSDTAPIDGEIILPNSSEGSSADATAANLISSDEASQASGSLASDGEPDARPTDTPASEREGGDAAGNEASASEEPVNTPNTDEPTPAIVAAAAPVASGPDAEASASGRFTFTAEEMDHIRSGADTVEAIIREVAGDDAWQFLHDAIVGGLDAGEIFGFGDTPDRDIPALPEAVNEVFSFEGSREAFYQNYPLTAAALDHWTDNPSGPVPIVRVTSKQAGFWRAGLQHSLQAADHDIRSLTTDQVELLLSEARLVVEIV